MNKTGFTLIELIIVIVLAGIIAGVITPFIANAVSYWALVSSERDVTFSARLAMNRMVREIRQIKDVASIKFDDDTRFKFIRIKDDGSEEDITFIQSPSSKNLLLRNDNELADKLDASNGLTFTYLDADGNKTGTTDDIRMVRIDLILVSGDATVAMQSLARFRNE